MIVHINGQEEHLEENSTLLDFLQRKGLDPQTLVIEYNGEILARERFAALRFQEGDQLEILRFVGGG